MVFATMLFGAALAATQAAETKPAVAGEISKAEAEAVLAKCGSRRFESAAEGLIDGKMRRTRLQLCAAESDSEAEWITKLEKSAASVEAQPRLPDNVKTKLLTDLRAEIARLRIMQAAPSLGVPRVAAPVGAIPSRPTPFGAPLRVADVTKTATVPPMPPRPKPGATAPQPVPEHKKPKLSAQCAVPGGGTVPCGFLSADTSLAVLAEAAVETPFTLRFRRTNSGRSEDIAIGTLRRGQMVRMKVPQAVCSGVVRARFDVGIVVRAENGSEVTTGTLGPFDTRC